MAYIYKIYNDINDKVYIGKTLRSINRRWLEHQSDYRNKSHDGRPIYLAMDRYGIENFHIELVEECDFSILSDREQYWITYYNSFENGYNATLGGDGTPSANYELIWELWLDNYNITQIHYITNHDVGTIRTCLDMHKVPQEEIDKRKFSTIICGVAMMDKNTNEILKVFESIADACRYLGKEHSGHIGSVCKGDRQTAYGYKWKYI